MKAITNKLLGSRTLLSACVVAFCVLGSGAYAPPQAKVKGTTSAAAVKQKRFATSQQAATALIEAAEQFDVQALVAIVGQANADLVITADRVEHWGFWCLGVYYEERTSEIKRNVGI